MSDLGAWDSFYVIVGSAAGALIGLQFVVMTLVAQRPRAADAGAAFGTPTIVHFSATLFMSALLRAPWATVVIPAALLGLVGLSGIIYGVITLRRMLRQSAYQPEFEDWLFHSALPLAAYVTLTLSACAAFFHPYQALFGIGAAVLGLLFIGIHNSWDSIAYHVFVASLNKDDG